MLDFHEMKMLALFFICFIAHPQRKFFNGCLQMYYTAILILIESIKTSMSPGCFIIKQGLIYFQDEEPQGVF